MKKQLGCNHHMEKDKIDIAHLIRSMQRLEKGPDCFGMADIQDLCHDKSCMWRKLCLENPRADRDGKNALNCRQI
jgi:hypothetical protein